MTATDTGRRAGGPAPRFDKATALRRKREMSKRYPRVHREIALWLERNYPKIFQKAREHGEAEVARERGPLPGD